MRGAIAAMAVITAVGLASAPASADPDTPDTASEALKQYRELTTKAEKINEKFLKAKDDLNSRRADLRTARTDLTRAERSQREARGVETQFRGQVDELSNSSLRGARFNKLSALFTGQSKQDFLERASALDIIAADNNDALRKLSGATEQATTAKQQAAGAKQRATKAESEAKRLVADIRKQNGVVQDKISEVKAALAELSPQDQAVLGDPGDQGSYIAPEGAAGVAMETALAQRGKPYVWAATGPDSFDCSGLMVFAYEAAGVSLPRSSASQATVGQAVDQSELRPGDLVFFGSPVHHVGMYVGDGMMVHASTSGVPVKVDSLSSQSDYSGARRVAG